MPASGLMTDQPACDATGTANPVARAATRGADADELLAIKMRLASGRITETPVPASRHRAIHLGWLHHNSDGFVEIASGHRPPGGKTRFTSRKHPGSYLPGGLAGGPDWQTPILELIDRQTRAGMEAAVAPAVRVTPAANAANVTHTSWLWIDVDGTEHLDKLRELLQRKRPHMVISSGGSGGMHAYWRLRTPLRAHTEKTALEGEVDWPGDWLTDGASRRTIETAHERLIYALGWQWEEGKPTPTVADGRCKDRSRVMRLAGTRNYKSGNYARIVWVDFALEPWGLRDLLGELPAAPKPKVVRKRTGQAITHDDHYKRIAPVEYFERLARIEVPTGGLVRCPNPAHKDDTPSCNVGADATEGWFCHGCGAGGAIYDLASVLSGGPHGQWLRGGAFQSARQRVLEAYGDAAAGASGTTNKRSRSR